MSNLLEIDSVVKNFADNQVLTDIYLKCKTGDIVGILGRNGTGKSTLLKILFGTLPADGKFIRIDGKVYDSPYKERNLLSFLPQNSFLPKHIITDKAVEFYLGKKSVPSFFDDPILTKLRRSKVSYLSGGEQRYLEIKLLLSLDSKFVLLDEPFHSVSPIIIESIKEIIIESSKEKGIILTDHDYRNVLAVANRYCLIFDGGIKDITDKQELVKWGYLSESKA